MRAGDLPPKIARDIHFATSEKMDKVPDSSVQSVICSPPYWYLKDYEHPDQIGHGESYGRYHERLNLVWSECERTLQPDGTMWIVVDKIWHESDVVHIPYDIAVNCQKLGMYLQDLVIWNKPTAIAGMNDRNLVNKFEYIVFLSKEPRGFKFRQPEESKRPPPDFAPKTGLLTDVWRFPVKAGSIRKTPNHKAPYPEELIARIVSVSTDEGDTVLDPFLGSGTTMKVALEVNRRCIGYEINDAFEPMIVDRLRTLSPPGRQVRLSAID